MTWRWSRHSYYLQQSEFSQYRAGLYHRHRGIRCKHQRRVAFATGDRPVPTNLDGVDEQLGERVDESPRVAATDGGEVINEDTAAGRKPGYTHHTESPAQGGATSAVRAADGKLFQPTQTCSSIPMGVQMGSK